MDYCLNEELIFTSKWITKILSYLKRILKVKQGEKKQVQEQRNETNKKQSIQIFIIKAKILSFIDYHSQTSFSALSNKNRKQQH